MRNDRPVNLGELPNAVKRVRTAADRCEVYGLAFVHSPSSGVLLLQSIDATFGQTEQARRQVLGVLMDRMAELRAEMSRTRL
ncbi:hypothetical protein [Streptomyces sp. NPDC002250]|uniref:hypothetical protein n=1 Tax=Streptomyces sp. NPDC002250 TaxID=3364641 RepID=UPI0036B123F1